MATAMTCSQCWTTVAAGKTHCPRCGAKLTGATPSVVGLLKSYPWLGVLLALSVLATVWAATRKPAPPVEVPPAAEPATVAPPPVEEPVSDEPLPPPPMPAPAPEPEPAPAGPAPRPDGVVPTIQDLMPPPPPR